jgi:hypothetical protein
LSLSSQIDYAQPDVRPATVAVTFNKATAQAGVNLRTVSGCPPAPTCLIEAVAHTSDGNLDVTMAGGGTASIYLPANIPQVRRIAVVAILSSTLLGSGANGGVVAYWGSEYNKNA